jgi:hypothetical protein
LLIIGFILTAIVLGVPVFLFYYLTFTRRIFRAGSRIKLIGNNKMIENTTQPNEVIVK